MKVLVSLIMFLKPVFATDSTERLSTASLSLFVEVEAVFTVAKVGT
jgi:hypothetical protein